MPKQSHEQLQQFAKDWQRDENLQRNFSKDPERVCKQYGLNEEEKRTLSSAAKKEGGNLKERISTALLKLGIKG